MPIRVSPLLCMLLLSACGAWPTTVDNRSDRAIQFAWHHRDYDHWSGPLDLPAGKATGLALNHYAEDFVGVRITDGDHAYAMTPDAITPTQSGL